MTEYRSLPVGYAYELLAKNRGDFNKHSKFKHLKADFKNFLLTLNSFFQIRKTNKLENCNFSINTRNIIFDKLAWKKTICDLEKDIGFNKYLEWSDIVIINGEGTIHHNYYGAQILLAMACIAKKAKKKCFICNSTIEAIDEYLIKKALQQVDYISVRDANSKEYLETYGISAKLAPDAAFIADYTCNDQVSLNFFNHRKKNNKYCLISSGIQYKLEALIQIINIAEKNGYIPFYYCFDSADNEAYRYCLQKNIKVITNTIISWKCFPDFLGNFDVCISGRHHLNVLAIIAGLPIIPIPSNTWKIPGTLSLLNKTNKIVYNARELNNALKFDIQVKTSNTDESYKKLKTMALNEYSLLGKIL